MLTFCTPSLWCFKRKSYLQLSPLLGFGTVAAPLERSFFACWWDAPRSLELFGEALCRRPPSSGPLLFTSSICFPYCAYVVFPLVDVFNVIIWGVFKSQPSCNDGLWMFFSCLCNFGYDYGIRLMALFLANTWREKKRESRATLLSSRASILCSPPSSPFSAIIPSLPGLLLPVHILLDFFRTPYASARAAAHHRLQLKLSYITCLFLTFHSFCTDL